MAGQPKEEAARDRLLQWFFVGAVGSFLCPAVLLGSHCYGDAVMPVDVQLRVGWFLFYVIDLPLLILGAAMAGQAASSLLRLRRSPGHGGRLKIAASLLLFIAGLGLHGWLGVRYLGGCVALLADTGSR